MNRLWEWLVSWLAVRKVSAAERAASRLASRLEKSIRLLGKRRKKLEALGRRLKDINQTVMEDLEQAESVQKQYEEAMELLRSDLQVQKEVMIPGLVGSHAALVEQRKLEMSVAVMGQVGASTREE